MRTEPPIRFRKINKGLDSEDIFVPFDTLQLLSAKSLGLLKLPKSKRHWGAFILAGHLGMIHGWRGIGKSLFSLGLGTAIACGVEFLGSAPARPRKVIIMDGEMDLRTLQRRSRQIHNSMGVEPTNTLKFVSPELFSGIMPSLTTPEGQKEIDDALGEDWDVLIIDNYSAFSSGREDADAWAPWNRWLLRHKRAGRTVIVIHHTGKSGTQRGASNHEDAMDFVMALRAPKVRPIDGSLQIVVSWTKSRRNR